MFSNALSSIQFKTQKATHFFVIKKIWVVYDNPNAEFGVTIVAVEFWGTKKGLQNIKILFHKFLF